MDWNFIYSLKGETLKTLSRSNPFDIVAVDEVSITIRPNSTNYERNVPRKEIEGAYNGLIIMGKITIKEIRDNGHSNFNPTYVAAILAELPNVSVQNNPTSLHFSD